MKKVLIISVIFLLAGLGVFFLAKLSQRKNVENKSQLENSVSQTIIKQNMQITSPSFENNQAIPSKFTCDGENINPQLDFSGVAQNAKSLVLIADDPDAPMGTWVHWVIFNMPATTKQIAENSVPADSIQGKTSWGKPGFGGPCPPSGTHRYFFKLYALDSLLNLDQTADKAKVEQSMQGHIIDQAQIIGLYKRK